MNELVKLAAEKQGLENPNQLWEAIGGARQTAYNIWEGKSKPKYDTTLLLMKMAELITNEKYEKLVKKETESALLKVSGGIYRSIEIKPMSQRKVTYRPLSLPKEMKKNVYYVKLIVDRLCKISCG